jgi:hypothetical protein
MPAPALEGRLLCACSAAYAITGNAPTLAPDPTNVYLNGAGFVRPPSIVDGGPREIDACLVGEIQDGLVVAFRGTLPFNIHQISSIRDWINDFEANPIRADGFPGFVHEGFFSALSVLIPAIETQLQQQRIGSLADKPLLITGHSKGGAVAGLAAWKFQGIDRVPVKVVTFAAAKPADASFRAAYTQAGIDHARYEYSNDIVPHVPLSNGGFVDILNVFPPMRPLFDGLERFDYQPVGVLRYINQLGQIQDDEPLLRHQRDARLVADLLTGHFAQIGSDHAIGCGSGYMQAAARTGVCV